MRVRCWFLTLIALASTATGYKKTEHDVAAEIRNAVEASDIWSTGWVRAKSHTSNSWKLRAGAPPEKIWISPKQWRLSLQVQNSNETNIGGHGQVWQSSNAQEKPLRVHEFERALAALSQTVVGEVKYAVREVPRKKTTRPSLSAHRQTTSNGPSFRIVLIRDTGLMLQVANSRQIGFIPTPTTSRSQERVSSHYWRNRGEKGCCVLQKLSNWKCCLFCGTPAVPTSHGRRELQNMPAGPWFSAWGKRRQIGETCRSEAHVSLGRPIIHYSATVYAIVGREWDPSTPRISKWERAT